MTEVVHSRGRNRITLDRLTKGDELELNLVDSEFAKLNEVVLLPKDSTKNYILGMANGFINNHKERLYNETMLASGYSIPLPKRSSNPQNIRILGERLIRQGTLLKLIDVNGYQVGTPTHVPWAPNPNNPTKMAGKAVSEYNKSLGKQK